MDKNSNNYEAVLYNCGRIDGLISYLYDYGFIARSSYNRYDRLIRDVFYKKRIVSFRGVGNAGTK